MLPPESLGESSLEALRQAIPAQQIGSGEDIASLAVHLALRAPYVTGQVWAVDGGRSVGRAMEVG